ncbi:MAG: thiol-disulfide oxidoreductase DCC family protein [Bacteroidota bacterium]|nr:thiol-disulfide oxidoreductase DCC family protein [Bacteroidota bacterium]
MNKQSEINELVLFDGVCNFCDSSVQFVIRKERKPTLKFASLQSPTGQNLLKKFNLNPVEIDSVVFVSGEKVYIKSTAALHLVKRLKGLYPLLFGFIIVPPFIRNAVYDWIARNRYKWYGKKDSCMIPTPEIRARFVDL